ncbi:hypothetical protein N7492_005943 [Penicillium capsulatum]|uniref:Zn(2)-C6 fungal-type domain-containing protein n=1 Tax=Penicillium capsulatum TaxID=69766 RepID=A0A9W9LSE8_9EURO|nr:hypothetical protein N7492_005943 [Penicillium capsulatum]KAJ6134954.1 hypothetical protein N7512_000114 [Penicillium capsulatum]
MVNSRGPSKGCQRCKKMKMKCSQEQPTYRRCEKAGHDCVYPSAFDRLHRDQNTAVKLLATKKWRQRARPKPAEPPYQDLGETLCTRAYRRFCFDFVIPFPGTMSNVPELMMTVDTESCLASAVAAVAYANYFSRYRSYEASEASSVCYGRTLQWLATLMTNPVELQREGVPLVVVLLAIYETMASSVRDGSWITTCKGPSRFLHIETASLTRMMANISLFCVYICILLQRRKDTTLISRRLDPQRSISIDHKHRLAILMLRTVRVITRLRENIPVDQRVASELLQPALDLDLELEAWTTELTPAWSSTTQHPFSHDNRPQWSRALLAGPGGPRSMICYPGALAAGDWNTYRATRIRLNLAIIDFLSRLPAASLEYHILKTHITKLLASLASEIACVFPYALSLSADGTSDPPSSADIPGMRAYLQLWPLLTAFICCQRHLDQGDEWVDRERWFKGVLWFLRDSMCLAKVQALLDETGTV